MKPAASNEVAANRPALQHRRTTRMRQRNGQQEAAAPLAGRFSGEHRKDGPVKSCQNTARAQKWHHYSSVQVALVSGCSSRYFHFVYCGCNYYALSTFLFCPCSKQFSAITLEAVSAEVGSRFTHSSCFRFEKKSKAFFHLYYSKKSAQLWHMFRLSATTCSVHNCRISNNC